MNYQKRIETMQETYTIFDIWNNAFNGEINNSLKTIVNSRDVTLLKLLKD